MKDGLDVIPEEFLILRIYVIEIRKAESLFS